MHGATANTPNSTIKPHCLAINLEEEPISVLYTGELFRLVNDYIKTPVELLFFSCQSGSAIKCVHLLPKNSKLVTFSNNENPISVASIEGFKYLNEHYIQDFSIKSFLEATALNGTPDTLNTTISISGKGINTFENYYNSLLGASEENPKLLSLTKENIKEIYEEFNKFHIFSKIQELLQDDNITEKELNEYLSIRPSYMLKLEEYYRPWGTKQPESIDEIVKNITPYTKLDEALYCLTTNPNFNYRDSYAL